jgi:Protein of unknown function (DUF2948)
MTDTDCLKLAALDEEDLAILSAHVQDSVLKVADMAYLPKEGRFVLVMNRFAWEQADGEIGSYERRQTALTFDRVRTAKTNGIQRDQGETILNLLALAFDPADPPAGAIELTFAGGAAVRLDVECIEARLTDLGATWKTATKPSHDLETEEVGPAG